MTQRVSKMGSPVLYQIIPFIDKGTERLETAVANEALPRVVRAAAARGIRMLNKYYSKTDNSIMYRISMCKLSCSL